MATLQGIQGMLGGFGDGAGGNIGLSLKEKVLKLLQANTTLSFLTATTKPDFTRAGSAYYRKIQVIQNEQYRGSNNSFQEPQADMIRVDLDSAMVSKYSYEIFNMNRVSTADELLSQIASSLYIGMQQQLNAAFLLFLKYHTLNNQAHINAIKTQTAWQGANFITPQAERQYIKVKALGMTRKEVGGTWSDGGALTPPSTIKPINEYGDMVYGDVLDIQMLVDELGTIYSKETIGINKTEFNNIISAKGQTSLSAIGRNQTAGTVGNFQIEKVSGKVIDGFKFITENMLDTITAAGASFNKDYTIDMKNVVGFLIHNEAVCMPIGEVYAWADKDPSSGNFLFGLRWMYGIGFLRPQLVCAFVKDGASVNVGNKFITGKDNTDIIMFNSTNNPKTIDDWRNSFPHAANPVAWNQPAFITTDTRTNTTVTGQAAPATGNTRSTATSRASHISDEE